MVQPAVFAGFRFSPRWSGGPCYTPTEHAGLAARGSQSTSSTPLTFGFVWAVVRVVGSWRDATGFRWKDIKGTGHNHSSSRWRCAMAAAWTRLVTRSLRRMLDTWTLAVFGLM